MDSGKPQEILIIRRGGGDDLAAVKGGAWKIAYADFVTAMMAFFLVMWLINSANEATKARVASYFNPIKFTDTATGAKSIKSEAEKLPSGKQPVKQSGDSDDNSEGSGAAKQEKAAAERGNEDKVLSNPFVVLEALSAEGELNAGGSGKAGQRAGDPFSPMAWEALKRGKKDETPASVPNTAAAVETDETAPAASPTASKEKTTEIEASVGKEAASGKAEAERTAKEILTELEKARHDTLLDLRIGIRVEVTKEGLLVTLEDSEANAMFDIGSAKPKSALIELIGRIGKILSNREGGIVVRGHTDGRKYRGERFDNWQLSTARAHMAAYMLQRGGLAENRLRKIEGYGDSQPLPGSGALDDRNRRVEFVLKLRDH